MMTNALVPKRTTYQQLSAVLAELGFQKRMTPQFTAYRNAQFDALIVLPLEALEQQVQPLHLAAARATVIGKGVATAEEFSRLLARANVKIALPDATAAPSAGKTAGAKKRAKKAVPSPSARKKS